MNINVGRLRIDMSKELTERLNNDNQGTYLDDPATILIQDFSRIWEDSWGSEFYGITDKIVLIEGNLFRVENHGFGFSATPVQLVKREVIMFEEIK